MWRLNSGLTLHRHQCSTIIGSNLSSSPYGYGISPPIGSGFNTQHRDSFVHRQELENAFYRDLMCCNQRMRDLHQLLRHFEEYHYPEVAQRMQEEEKEHQQQQQEKEQQPKQNEGGGEQMEQDHQGVTMLTEAAPLPKDTITTTTTTPIPDTRQHIIIEHSVVDDTIASHLADPLTDFEPPPQDFFVFPTSSIPSTPTANIYEDPEKPYKCPVPGCYKSYKNPNGLKYHKEHGHVNGADDESTKPFRCTIGMCRKRYKQMSGLRYHITHSHPEETLRTELLYPTQVASPSPPPSSVHSLDALSQPSSPSTNNVPY